MKTVIIATKNSGKAKEFIRMFKPYGVEVKTLLDFPEIEDIEETGQTFEENAVIKAETVCKLFNQMVIADDSGLIVDALDGRPGIYSARYAGEEKNDEANNDKILNELKYVKEEDRKARFYCALAFAMPEKDTITVNGKCEGSILFERRGTNGFGYDPLFYVTEMKKSMAELSPDEKNQISHRAKALQKLEDQLAHLFSKEKES
ncbi:XTP/dITP diphosphatase [Niallia endozanthoxylica]|uniref:dITP/XTP pyrophosphatase n=1 Tax=Niallia endozanthoxylica TaxID=2036016 RepID=A0A5J5HNX4_9BACI|nr:XTP/dITP diphosphatase [Niallia endozanthoxylica]KAA9023171.1 XTP/dITP diphosphatase [Niallia endozanthoxylica]